MNNKGVKQNKLYYQEENSGKRMYQVPGQKEQFKIGQGDSNPTDFYRKDNQPNYQKQKDQNQYNEQIQQQSQNNQGFENQQQQQQVNEEPAYQQQQQQQQYEQQEQQQQQQQNVKTSVKITQKNNQAELNLFGGQYNYWDDDKNIKENQKKKEDLVRQEKEQLMNQKYPQQKQHPISNNNAEQGVVMSGDYNYWKDDQKDNFVHKKKGLTLQQSIEQKQMYEQKQEERIQKMIQQKSQGTDKNYNIIQTGVQVQQQQQQPQYQQQQQQQQQQQLQQQDEKFQRHPNRNDSSGMKDVFSQNTSSQATGNGYKVNQPPGGKSNFKLG